MTVSIENQIHQYLIEAEEIRCKTEEERTGKKVNRRTISKPWNRSGEYALCQEYEYLLMVDEYDYDLSNPAFQDYCNKRGILHCAGVKGSKYWNFFLDYRKSKDEYLSETDFQFAAEYEGKKYNYSAEEMESGWRIVRLGRAKFQDCWELFNIEKASGV
jgi:hypothetical protein